MPPQITPLTATDDIIQVAEEKDNKPSSTTTNTIGVVHSSQPETSPTLPTPPATRRSWFSFGKGSEKKKQEKKGDKKKKEQVVPENITPCPMRQNSSLWAKFTYNYMNEMIGRGFRRELVTEDYPPIEDLDEAGDLSTRLREAWDTEVRTHGPQNAKLWRATWKVFGWRYIIGGLWFLLESLVKIATAVVLSLLLNHLSKPNEEKGNDGWYYALALSLCIFFSAFLHHIDFFLCMRVGMQVRTAFIATIYRKCLSLSISHTSSTGMIVNLVSNDVQRFEDAAT
ncbi:Multidrug resistance-associated protein 4, partial [Quaeritorhiza haematococci]